jgi:anti-sigma B factor antagonist
MAIDERTARGTGASALPQGIGSLRRRPVREVQRGADWALVVLEGELDLYNVEEVREVLQSVCGTGPRKLVVDLSRVAFIDSSALHALLGARKLLRDWGGLVLSSPTGPVLRALEASGANRVLTIDRGGSVDNAWTSRGGDFEGWRPFTR